AAPRAPSVNGMRSGHCAPSARHARDQRLRCSDAGVIQSRLTVDLYGRWLPMENKAAVDRLDETPVRRKWEQNGSSRSPTPRNSWTDWAAGESAAEELLQRVEEAADQGALLGVGGSPLELLDQLALARGELGRHLDDHAVAGVAAAARLEGGHPLAGEPEDLRVLGPGGHLQLGGALEDGHRDLGAQGGLGEGHRQGTEQVEAVAAEEGVLADVDDHVEIARGRAARPAVALAGEAKAHAVLDAGRDRHLERPLVGHAALAPAGLARVLGDLPLPRALGAG